MQIPRAHQLFDNLIWLNGKHVLIALMALLTIALFYDGEQNVIVTWMEANWIGRWINTLPAAFLLCTSVLIGARVKTSSIWFLVLTLPYLIFMLGLLNYTLVGTFIRNADGEIGQVISATNFVFAIVLLGAPLVSWFMARVYETLKEQADQLKRKCDLLMLENTALQNEVAASKAETGGTHGILP